MPAVPHPSGDPEHLPENSFEERRIQTAVTPREYLQQLPALVLLDRLATPALAIGCPSGELVYANPALATLLGYPHTDDLTDQPLPALMPGHHHRRARDCLTELRAAANTVTQWRHGEGYCVHTVTSPALLTRATDPLLLITLTDVTDLHWS